MWVRTWSFTLQSFLKVLLHRRQTRTWLRRFVFLFWAWIRLQRRLLLARFKPEGGQDS